MASSTAFRINGWTVEPELNLISQGGETIRIPPKFMQVLVALAERPGGLVTRTELLARVWGETVVVEAVVTRAVSELRRLLSTPGVNLEIIETIPKAGYRLVAPISWVTRSSETNRSLDVGRRRSVVRITGLSVGIGALLTLVALVGSNRRHSSFDIDGLRPVTSFQGEEYDPVLSPDGATLAFVMDQKVFLKDVESPAYRRLTDDYAAEASPAWSPDGLKVAYLRCTGDQSAVFVSPVAAPYPEVVTELHPAACRNGSTLDWSPDGLKLAFADIPASRSGTAIYVLDVSSAVRKKLSSPERAFENHRHPVFSVDGSTIAFTSGAGTSGELWTVDTSGASVSRVATGLGSIEGLDWLPDGHELVFASDGALWRVDRSGGHPKSILDGALYYTQPAFSKSGDQLAFVRTQFDVNIRQIEVANGADDEPESFFESTHIDGDPRISPDGRRVAFISDSDGACSLWIGHRDGTPATRIVRLAPTCMRMPGPRWSPDGKRLALSLNRYGHSDVFTVDTVTRELTRVTSGASDEWMPSWSNSGDALFFTSNRTGRPEIWMLSLNGERLEQITRSGGMAGLASADGRTLFFTKSDTMGIWSVPVEGRDEEELLVSDFDPVDAANWRVSGENLYFLVRSLEGPPRFTRLHLPTGESIEVAALPNDACLRADIDPDGTWIVFAQVDYGGGDIQVANTRRL